MMLGPVFQAELLRASRRARYYWLRFLYGLVVLFLIWVGYESAFAFGLWQGNVTIADVANFAEGTFVRFAILQFGVVLLLIPAIFGGAIADEKQRKTLHYLMASQLSSGEILIDKLLARAAHLFVLVGIGLPVVSLLGLFGGVPVEYVFVAYVGTFSTATFAICLTLLVSTLARSVRQAVLISYVLMGGWLVVPPMMNLFGSMLVPALYSWVSPVVSWVANSSPLWVWFSTMLRRPTTTASMVRSAAVNLEWMVSLQLGGSLALFLLAMWRLRPTFRDQEGKPPRRSWFKPRASRPGARKRWLARPECGDDAMSWKECYFARSDIVTKLVVLPATVVISLLIFLTSGLDEWFYNAATDIWNHGFRARPFRQGVSVWSYRMTASWYVLIWLIAVAGSSASCVAIEREEDTWITLTSTPLSGWRIIRGKLLGVLWNQRGFGVFLGMTWLLGLIVGALDPLAVVLSVVVVAIETWLIAMLGIYSSLRSRSTSRAMIKSLVGFACLNAWPIYLTMAFVNGWWLGLGDTYLAWVGFMPRLASGALVGPDHVAGVWDWARTFGLFSLRTPGGTLISFAVVVFAVYMTLGVIFTWRSVGVFDKLLDRPRLGHKGPAPVAQPRTAEPVLQS
jgi:ABC-type transport system involved in multi-copper enzyme maturation permease subunit